MPHIGRDHVEAQPQIFGEAALREQLSTLDELSLYGEGLREESNRWERWRLTLCLEEGKGMEWNGKKRENILRIFFLFSCLEV